MKEIVLSFGSNVGNRVKNIEKALILLKKFGIYPVRISSFYLTKPVGFVLQPSFINLVGIFQTELLPQEVLKVIKKIENKFYRLRLFKNAPRVLDIDILFYNSEIIDEKNLKIPHPRILERNFILIPLLEIAPNLFHPLTKKTLKDSVKEINNNGIKLWRKEKLNILQ
ncbi:MAG: 2-amino-4-hydroxy-6-hydroxymethyldihydropteridine diphosphokinase [candidate division WOR-3 bacterium]|nr:2-amino-4-hydroxy-6-hydroxymethyldihydropteridine diphosphokinase [candidate division WOR-3 bacterium]MDW8114546.1 2-amino-4-hydroxy-6-hydroxymethyldihydropteridine diphosphokinase [candidate division WOR-3 bacterium]